MMNKDELVFLLIAMRIVMIKLLIVKVILIIDIASNLPVEI